jgi:hypothetical protein
MTDWMKDPAAKLFRESGRRLRTAERGVAAALAALQAQEAAVAALRARGANVTAAEALAAELRKMVEERQAALRRANTAHATLAETPKWRLTTMADDKTKIGKSDRDRINVDEPYELQYWSEKFEVTPERLRQAVKTSGPMVKDIAALLGKTL